jgi:hypothetical protein
VRYNENDEKGIREKWKPNQGDRDKMKKQQRNCAGKDVSRRDFLKRSVLLGTGLVVGVHPEIEASASGAKVPVRRSRIVRAYSPNATSWDYQSNYYFDFVDQDIVNQMVLEGALELTKGDLGRIAQNYQIGDKWAIKINCNNYSDASNEIDATAPVMIAVLRLLIEDLSVPAPDITIYDASRSIPNFRIRDRIPYSVNFAESGDPQTEADYSAPITFRNIATQYLPYVVSESQHLINIPLFKDHLFVLSTMAFKNHFGTSKPGPAYLHSPIDYNLSDLNANVQIRQKTRLIVGDALFGVWDGGPYGWPMRWNTFPGGPTPNSIFLGFDPVAHESVMVDYLIAEQEYHSVPLLSHFFLHDAMEYHDLGVHEHRNENGRYRQIDYVEMEV